MVGTSFMLIESYKKGWLRENGYFEVPMQKANYGDPNWAYVGVRSSLQPTGLTTITFWGEIIGEIRLTVVQIVILSILCPMVLICYLIPKMT